jgi:hypothetical protein
MGLETAALVLGGIAIAGEVGQATMQSAAAAEKQKALDLQGKEMRLQSNQKTLANYDVMEKVIQSQQAHMTTTGAAFSSPSYNAIQRNTLNIGAKKGRNDAIEGSLSEENTQIEKANVQNTLYAQLFGDVSQGAKSAAGVYSAMPTKAGAA